MIILAWIRDAAEWLWAISPVKYTIISIVRLCLAALLGGIIGYEREHSHRPAGFRTHILVAVGSAVVMLTAVYMSERYPDHLDISRMPAQVVSGIGFLGAGTILREGFSVKGLTTAASLWAVSCVGLAVGSGFAPIPHSFPTIGRGVYKKRCLYISKIKVLEFYNKLK